MKLLIIAVFGLLILNSCKKEDPEPWLSTINYDGTLVPLQFCFAKEFWRMEPQQGYNFDLFLFSSELTVNDSTNLLAGTGSHFFAEFYCESDALEGTFTYNESKAENTFSASELYVNYNFDTGTGTKTYLKQGTATISITNGQILLSINGTTLQNLPVEIIYNGKIVIE